MRRRPRIVDWDSPLRTASRRLRSRHGRPLHSRFRGQVNAFGFKSWPVHEHRSLWAVWSPRAAGDPTGWWAPAGRPQAGHRPQGLHGVVRIPTARDSPARSDAAACCRSSDHSDQKTVVRRVQYPWHPLYGQDVIVRETRASRRVLRCQVDDDETRDNREIPLWMFDAVRCARMVPTSQPQVCWAALLDLRRLLDETRPDEKPAAIEDRCPSTTEGTDATSSGTTWSRPASRPVRTPAPAATLAGPASRHAHDGGGAARPTARRRAAAPASDTPRGGGA